MNKKLVSVVMIMLMPLTGMAAVNDASPHEWHRGERIERLTQELGLSADQKAQLVTIFQQHHEKLKALHDEQHKLLEGVLTKEQMAKYDTLRKERYEKWQQKHHQDGEHTGPAPL